MNRIRKKQTKGFTLVELLVVMGIIAILIGLLFPAIGAARKAARKAQAQTEVRAIAAAIEAYLNEYGKLPVPDEVQGDGEDDTSFTGMAAYNTADRKPAGAEDVIKILTYAEGESLSAGSYAVGATVEGMNPRGIVFLEAQDFNAPGEFLDPWGEPYIMKFDCDYNGKVEWFSGGAGSANEKITKACIVYSLGPDPSINIPNNTVLPNDEFPDVVASHFNK